LFKIIPEKRSVHIQNFSSRSHDLLCDRFLGRPMGDHGLELLDRTNQPSTYGEPPGLFGDPSSNVSISTEVSLPRYSHSVLSHRSYSSVSLPTHTPTSTKTKVLRWMDICVHVDEKYRPKPSNFFSISQARPHNSPSPWATPTTILVLSSRMSSTSPFYSSRASCLCFPPVSSSSSLPFASQVSSAMRLVWPHGGSCGLSW
jgi:hypothetical protein